MGVSISQLSLFTFGFERAPIEREKRMPKVISEAESGSCSVLRIPPPQLGKVKIVGPGRAGSETLWKWRVAKQPAVALRDVGICELLCAGGLRASELTGAKLQDLDLNLRCLRVVGKGDKEQGAREIVSKRLPSVRERLNRTSQASVEPISKE